ncbi:hypothetical protein LOD99_6133 [Oopsacas minuta]|uniref:Uncharacterized protein n=1 Tax=Oopsacas minuta TaxID=111878 RepID=A0AAV7JPC3_9METZ|nr:hypothetical protein LOD99_6133 [Oopsacas minuta]
MLIDVEGTQESVEVKEVMEYSLKKHPVLTVYNNKLYRAEGIAIEEHYQLIFIADWERKCIQVLTFEGNFVTSFGRSILRNPNGIAVTKDYLLITDTMLSALFQFSDYNLMRIKGPKEEKLSDPYGLCIDYNGEVYVADYGNNRVSIFSQELNFKNCIGTLQLRHPKDVKVTINSIIVLDSSPKCVHIYSRSGHLLNSCVSNGRHGMVDYPSFFCIDLDGNILISDRHRHGIQILSPSGQHIHTIARRRRRRAELELPTGICISTLGTIFVVSNYNHSVLQLF